MAALDKDYTISRRITFEEAFEVDDPKSSKTHLRYPLRFDVDRVSYHRPSLNKPSEASFTVTVSWIGMDDDQETVVCDGIWREIIAEGNITGTIGCGGRRVGIKYTRDERFESEPYRELAWWDDIFVIEGDFPLTVVKGNANWLMFTFDFTFTAKGALCDQIDRFSDELYPRPPPTPSALLEQFSGQFFSTYTVAFSVVPASILSDPSLLYAQATLLSSLSPYLAKLLKRSRAQSSRREAARSLDGRQTLALHESDPDFDDELTPSERETPRERADGTAFRGLKRLAAPEYEEPGRKLSKSDSVFIDASENEVGCATAQQPDFPPCPHLSRGGLKVTVPNCQLITLQAVLGYVHYSQIEFA
ncbi:hypothetical protein JCM11491_006090 [Sporobolomyces phaffii]